MTNRYRLFSGLVLTALTVQLTGFAGLANAAMDTQNHWASQNINSLMSRSVIGGYPDGTFRPENTITRAEFSAILAKALQLNAATGYSSFNDVPAGHWAAGAINAAKNANLVSGYPDGGFHPNEPVSRAALMAVLANAIPGQPDANTVSATLNQYTDGSNVPGWAQVATAEAIQQQVFANDPYSANRIDANMPATRAEVAAMVDKYLARKAVAFAPVNNNTVANNNQNTNSNNGDALQGYVATIPENTQFSATLQNAINSETAKAGDQVKLTLDMPIATATNQIAIPSGTTIIGEIAEVEAAGRLENNAMVQLRFNEFVLSNGERIPMKASIATEANDGTIHGGNATGSAGKVAGKTAIGAGLGAALGTAMGPLSGGKVGKGAIYGTAIGAGLGALTGLSSKGNEVEIPSGQSLVLSLDETLQISK